MALLQPSVVHDFPSSQVSVIAPLQIPDSSHVSACDASLLQALLSLQVFPAVLQAPQVLIEYRPSLPFTQRFVLVPAHCPVPQSWVSSRPSSGLPLQLSSRPLHVSDDGIPAGASHRRASLPSHTSLPDLRQAPISPLSQLSPV